MNEIKKNSLLTRVQRTQTKFLVHLEELTRLKKARWVRSTNQPGLVLCRIGDEMLVFEASNGCPDPVDPDGEVGGVVCKFRNYTWLWLTPLEEGQRILELLRKAKKDNQKFMKWRVNTNRSGVKFLQNALKKKIR